jgi:hypothetical protein
LLAVHVTWFLQRRNPTLKVFCCIFQESAMLVRRCHVQENDNEQKTNCVALSSRASYTDRRPPLVGEVSANFSGVERRVVSATCPHSH